MHTTKLFVKESCVVKTLRFRAKFSRFRHINKTQKFLGRKCASNKTAVGSFVVFYYVYLCYGSNLDSLNDPFRSDSGNFAAAQLRFYYGQCIKLLLRHYETLETVAVLSTPIIELFMETRIKWFISN